MSLLNAVNPRNDAFAGFGSLTTAASPVAVSGTYETPGAPGFPNPGAGQINSARNNSGTNVRIPYARLVPMRGNREGPTEGTQWAHIPGVQMRDGTVGRPLGAEYDGLDTGELAWIMGRNSNLDGTGTYVTRSAHGGMGFGVDRMQRLASQFYIENYFRARFGDTVINLAQINLGDAKLKKISNELNVYGKYVAGASVLGSVDLPHVINSLFRPAAVAEQLQYAGATVDAPMDAVAIRGPPGTPSGKEGFASGLLVVEKSPFLRGKINDVAAVEMLAPELSYTIVGGARKHTVARNLGDRLAFDALYAELRIAGMFDWTPDGLVLSKLESPSGDPLSSAELDARQAQLFNVAIQGPAITKTWTGNPAMQVMPLDRVFVVIVADVSTAMTDTATDGYGATTELKAVWDAYKKYEQTDLPINLTGAIEDANTAFDNKVTNGKAGAGEYALALKDFFAKSKALSSNTDTTKTVELKTALAEAQIKMQSFFGPVTEDEIDTASAGLKTGTKGVATSAMTNFRLVRLTSSFLINTSAAVFTKEAGVSTVTSSSRCGLKIGKKDPNTFTGEYIVGGWCVGSVLDSAASRSAIGSQMRTAPASMAINVNVNVEWWSGDDLYRRYADVDGTVQQRGVLGDSETSKQDQRRDGFDVAEAARKEAKSFLPF